MSLEAALKQSLGYAAVRSVGRRGHGDTASGSAFEVTDDAGNKSTVYVKSSSQQGAKEMFEGEYASLVAMERTGCIRVPHPVRALDNPRGGGGGALLVEEFLDLKGGLSGEPARQLGRSFARMHLHNIELGERGSPEYVSRFGFPVATFCGQLVQGNKWRDDWPTYYTEKLQEQMDFLKRDGGDAEAERLWAKLKERIPTFFEGIGEVKPSLLHGDLWSGNAGVTSDGVGVIYDPGSFYGHHEYDLGIAGMFGFSSDFLAAYHELIPKAGEPGFENRHKLYQLFHYMNHWNIFGGGYRSSSISIMKQLTVQR